MAALFPSLFVFTFILWLGLSVWVVVGRLVYEARQLVQQKVQRELEDLNLAGLSPELRARAVHQILARYPRRSIDRLVVANSPSASVLEVYAQHVLTRYGLATILLDAAGNERKPDTWRRISALQILTRIRQLAVYELLEKALLAPDDEVVGAAIVLLGALGDTQAAQILIAALRDGSPFSSRIATQLEHFPDHAVRSLQLLLSHSNSQVRYWAAFLLARHGAFPGLDGELAPLGNDPDPHVRRAAVQALGRIGGPRATYVAIKLLADPTGYVRAYAIRALGVLGRTECAGKIAALMTDQDWWVRLAAKETLVDMGPRVWRDAAAQLDSADAFARDGAAEVLQNMGVLPDLVAQADGGANSEETFQILLKAIEAGGRGVLEASLSGAEPGVRARVEVRLAAGNGENT